MGVWSFKYLICFVMFFQFQLCSPSSTLLRPQKQNTFCVYYNIFLLLLYYSLVYKSPFREALELIIKLLNVILKTTITAIVTVVVVVHVTFFFFSLCYQLNVRYFFFAGICNYYIISSVKQFIIPLFKWA